MFSNDSIVLNRKYTTKYYYETAQFVFKAIFLQICTFASDKGGR